MLTELSRRLRIMKCNEAYNRADWCAIRCVWTDRCLQKAGLCVCEQSAVTRTVREKIK
jgi:hypothetical protein